MLVNNAGVAHYMPFTQLPVEKASELLHVKVVAPTRLSRAVAWEWSRGARARSSTSPGCSPSAARRPWANLPGRAIYVGSLAYLVAVSQALHEELKDSGVAIQVLCPGVVATEFHTRQGMDLSAIPRMSPADVVTASLRGLRAWRGRLHAGRRAERPAERSLQSRPRGFPRPICRACRTVPDGLKGVGESQSLLSEQPTRFRLRPRDFRYRREGRGSVWTEGGGLCLLPAARQTRAQQPPAPCSRLIPRPSTANLDGACQSTGCGGAPATVRFT